MLFVKLTTCRVFFNLLRGQDQHIRYEHIYLTEPPGQSEVDYTDIKRPRIEMGPESLVRPSSHRQPLSLGGAEDMTKVSSVLSMTFYL